MEMNKLSLAPQHTDATQHESNNIHYSEHEYDHQRL